MNAWVMCYCGLALPRKDPICPVKSIPYKAANMCTAHDAGTRAEAKFPCIVSSPGQIGSLPVSTARGLSIYLCRTVDN